MKVRVSQYIKDANNHNQEPKMAKQASKRTNKHWTHKEIRTWKQICSYKTNPNKIVKGWWSHRGKACLIHILCLYYKSRVKKGWKYTKRDWISKIYKRYKNRVINKHLQNKFK